MINDRPRLFCANVRSTFISDDFYKCLKYIPACVLLTARVVPKRSVASWDRVYRAVSIYVSNRYYMFVDELLICRRNNSKQLAGINSFTQPTYVYIIKPAGRASDYCFTQRNVVFCQERYFVDSREINRALLYFQELTSVSTATGPGK